jgi:transposase-like protein
MPKKRFTDEQIAFALRQAEAGTSVDEICRKMGVAEATFTARRSLRSSRESTVWLDAGPPRRPPWLRPCISSVA